MTQALKIKTAIDVSLKRIEPRLADYLQKIVRYDWSADAESSHLAAIKFECFAHELRARTPIEITFYDANWDDLYPAIPEPIWFTKEPLLIVPDGMDDYGAVYDTIVERLPIWLAKLWNNAGGNRLSIDALFYFHDQTEAYHLTKNTWQPW